jgi:5'-nucleotidase
LRELSWLIVVSISVTCACARGATTPRLVDVQILAFNDFHGSLEPAAGTNGLIEGTVVGGVEYLATHMARLRSSNPNTIVVSAGDNIGATPFLSGMFHDEPTIEALNLVGLEVSAVGNHEFDEGWWEAIRMQRGGCHPTDGCQDESPFRGARFAYLSANVVVNPAQADPDRLREVGWTPTTRSRTLFPASVVRTFDGVKVGFIGIVVSTAPDIVQPAATRGLTFRAEAVAANEEAARLVAQGVQAIVVLIHEGATPGREAYDGCENVTGPVIEITKALSPAIDAVIAGHVHRAYNCTIDGRSVTSAASLGRVITDLDLRIDARTGEVVSRSARNIPVTRDVPRTAAVTELIARYRPLAARVGARVVGTLAAEIPREPNASGESALGDVVADAFLEAGRMASPGPAEAAVTNIGGIRAGLVGQAMPAGTRQLTYAEAFEALPFGNRVQVKTISGDALIRLLEQQFDNPGPGRATILQVAGLTYAYNPTRPAGQRVNRASIRLAGQPLDPARRYRIVSNDFVWNGGDGFAAAIEGVEPIDVGADVDVLVDYLRTHPAVQPGRMDRLVREP